MSKLLITNYFLNVTSRQGEDQRWSRGPNARGQGQGQPYRGQTLSRPRTKNKSASALRKKRSSEKFSGDLKKKNLQKTFLSDLQKKTVFQNIFQALHELLTTQKVVLSSSREQSNFGGLEALRPRTCL